MVQAAGIVARHLAAGLPCDGHTTDGLAARGRWNRDLYHAQYLPNLRTLQACAGITRRDAGKRYPAPPRLAGCDHRLRHVPAVGPATIPCQSVSLLSILT